jgi:molybdate transport system substrate-binding protein
MIQMKHIFTIVLALFIALSAAVCGAAQSELIVFAAASMTETLQEIAGLYAKVEPNVKLTFNFDSSGTLKTQIQEGAECDMFISAGQRQVDQLDITASDTVNTEKLDFIDKESRIDLLENRVTLVVPSGNPKKLKSFDDLNKALAGSRILMAMGNSDVPVGQYTQRILAYYKLDEKALASAGTITYGSNVKEVTTQVAEASVDCGVIYCTDAFSAKLEVVDYATPEMCGRIIYPAAVLKTSFKKPAARAFLKYLTTDDAMTVFKSVGFSKP